MRKVWHWFLPVVAILIVGCKGGDYPEVADASGTVTMNGQPVEGAKVMFHPVDGGSRFSHGTTDAEGKFKLSTFGLNDGALIGKHKVTLAKVELPDEATKIDVEAMKKGGIVGGMPGYQSAMGIGDKKAEKPKFEIPEKYTKIKDSPVEVEVTKDGQNEFTIKIE